MSRHYTRLPEKQSLYLRDDAAKWCHRRSLDDRAVREFYTTDPRHIVGKILAGPYVEIGTDVIEGKAVRGVELRDPNLLIEEEGQKVPPLDDFAARFWIDVQTELPVWMEISFVLQGSAVRRTMIMDRFEWGVPLEATLFEPEIPADYQVIEHDPSRKPPEPRPQTPTEEAFAQHTLAEPYLGDFDALPLRRSGACRCSASIRTSPGRR